MIDNKQMRVGNWIMYEGKPHQWQENDFIDKEIRVNGNYIPIDDKIYNELEQQCCNEMVEAGVCLQYREGQYWLLHEYMNMKIKGLVVVEYLHHFQNCYHALTRSDVRINITPLSDIKL